MLLNISSDRILFYSNNERIILPYGELEQNLPDFLYSHINPTTTKDLVIINGPGSFTNLRIATLALNTYSMLHKFSIRYGSVTKVSYFAALYRLNKVKRYCIMYIGQKKNFWLVDLEKVQGHDSKTIMYSPDIVKKIHIHDIIDVVSYLDGSWFVDEVVAEAKETFDLVFGQGRYDLFSFQNHVLVDIPYISYATMIEPQYLIEANID